MNRQQVPALDKRPETGPMRFGDDWTGLFLRGDCALGYLSYVMIARSYLPDPQRAMLNGIIELLASADERNFRDQSVNDSPKDETPQIGSRADINQ